MTKRLDDLTPKQRKFVQIYVATGNATQSAKDAGYSKRTAYRTGNDNLKKPQIARAIAAETKKATERNELTQDWVIQGIMREADFKDAGASHSARVKAFEVAARILSMMTDNVNNNHSGNLDIVQRLQAARQRAADGGEQ
jgi:phage terminase small subunit